MSGGSSPGSPGQAQSPQYVGCRLDRFRAARARRMHRALRDEDIGASRRAAEVGHADARNTALASVLGLAASPGP